MRSNLHFKHWAVLRSSAYPTPVQKHSQTGLRRWRVRGFENFMIFYHPLSNGIEIVRVLHGARDIESLFE
jgi:plasmid stabilization system protein ParE